MRRLLTAVAALGALLTAAPAVAAPAHPPRTEVYQSLHAYGSVADPAGRTAQVSVSRWYSDGTWYAAASIWSSSTVCDDSGCSHGFLSGHVEVDPDLVDFPRTLERAAVTVDLPWTRWSSGSDGYLQESGVTPVRIEIAGTGSIWRDASHQRICGDGESYCQSVRVEAGRTAQARLEGFDTSWAPAGDGGIFRGQGIDAGPRTPIN